MLVGYTVISYYTDKWVYERRQRKKAERRQGPDAMSAPDVRSFTVGMVQENSYIVRADAQAKRAVIVDPGDEAERLLEGAAALGVEIEAILLTHTHFDHIGAVAPVARATGAPVYCPKIEQPVLADVMRWVPPGFGPFESYDADHTLAGGEHLELAGMDIDVIFTPGHSPGHLTFAFDGAVALRRRALPGLRRPRRPAGRRLGDARAVDRGPGARLSRRDRPSTPATWASRRSGGSATPTPS